MAVKKEALFLLLLIFAKTRKNEEIASEATADIGKWSDYFYCPSGSFAYAFRTQIDYHDIEWGDKSALNGLELRCNDPERTILSFEGEFGTFAEKFSTCVSNGSQIDTRNLLTAFKVRIQPVNSNDYDADDTALNAIRMKCAARHFIASDEHSFGEWKEEVYCPEQSAICGFRAKYDYEGIFKISEFSGHNDYTGLNRIEFICCPFD